jgi:nicotinate-nucleotide adenylyltransferase
MNGGQPENGVLKQAGIFGGTFNPVHFGHLRTALEVMENYRLDRVYFIPAADPPHKNGLDIADRKDRYAMLSLAICDTPGFSISDIELKRGGRSYTIDTVSRLVRKNQSDMRYFLIVGIDAFMEIDTWKDYTKIFELVSFIVMSRPEEEKSCHENVVDKILHHLKENVSPDYILEQDKNVFLHPFLKSVHFIFVTGLGISATRIRRTLKEGGSIRYLVPDGVANYIKEKRLYV